MKLVFIDIDGVLVTTRHWVQSRAYFGHEFDPVCAGHLRQLLERTGARLVVSSSWREGRTLAQLQSIFRINGIEGVIGMMPVIDGAPRVREIQSYLAACSGVERFVILDDEEDMGPLAGRWLSTEFACGMTEETVEAAAALLG